MSGELKMLMTVAFLVLVGTLLGGCSEADMEAMVAQEYCEMTAKWKADARNGVPVAQRNGWPDFNMNADEICGG